MSREQCRGEVMMRKEVRREDGADERHIVFMLTFTQRWSAAASCQQDSLWAFLEMLPVLKWFAGARVVCTVRVTVSVWVNKTLFCTFVHREHISVRGEEANDGWRGKKVSSDVRKRTGHQTNSQPEFELPELTGKAFHSLPRRSLTSPSLGQTHTSKSTTSNPFPHLHLTRGLDFSSNQNKSLR